jgi:Cytochrome P450
MLMLDFLPYFTAHKAHLGRAKVQAALRAYFNAGYDLDDDVSPFIKRRTFIQRKYGFGSDEFAGWDLAMMMVATTNAIPTLFWNIVYVLSSPSIISSIRGEVTAITARSTDPTTGKPTMTIDASKFATHCPLLCAAYQESMRLCNRQMSIRVAEEDTSVTSLAEGEPERTYLIKKNSVMLLPSSLYSEDPKVWGSNAHLFEPARWLKDSAGKVAKEAERLQKKAFFPFGGGRHLCPGRHFAFAEILGMVALLVVGFDVEMADGKDAGTRPGAVRVPARESRFFGEAVPKPVGRYDVLVRRKKEFEGVRWGFDLGSA